MAAIRIDPSSAIPIFRQIVDGIRVSIASGVYQPGDLIPSVRQMSVQILVNPNTVQRAYEELERQGLIESRKGVGMEVTAKSQTIALEGAIAAVQSALEAGVDMAQAAKMSRADVDAKYEQAWKSKQRNRGGSNG